MPPNGDLVLRRPEVLDRVGWKSLADVLTTAAAPGDPTYRPGARSLVAIIDSGLRTHPELLEDRIAARFNATDGSEDVTDTDGHGTELTGIVAGTGTEGAGHGIAPGANLIVIKVAPLILEHAPSPASIPTTAIIRALQWLVTQRAAIEQRTGRHLGAVCLARAGGPCVEVPPPNWESTGSGQAIRTLRQAGVLTVVGAGNSYHTLPPGTEGMQWPAILPACVSVGATYDEDMRVGGEDVKADQITYYSNRILAGDYRTTLFAPGSRVRTTSNCPSEPIVESNGTSSATPAVCGAVLLVQELFFLRKNVWPTAQETLDILRRSARILDAGGGLTYPFLHLVNVPQNL